MFKRNKLKIIISSIIILLPVLYGVIMWNDLPDTLTTHWGADGSGDGFSEKAFAVFGLPCILLALHFVCLTFTFLDKKQKEQNRKALGMIFWIIPVISLLVNSIMYRAAFGKEINVQLVGPTLFGAMFVFMGNYLPKIKQNNTLGIKLSWTLNNEENWNKTHRFSGKAWVVGGFVMLLSGFFPLELSLWITVCALAVLSIAPIVYSYCIYRKHQKEGVLYDNSPRSKSKKIAVRIAAVIVSIILIGIAILMFTGDMDVECRDTSFKINATYWTDIEVDYDDVDTAQYRKDFDVGIRTNGFGSARLSMGIFENEEFGSYTLYAYTGAKDYIVLTSDGKTLVMGFKDENEAREIYDAVSQKTNLK